MTNPADIGGIRPDPVGRVLLAASRALAALGGLVLVAITMLTVVSIAGRAVASAPVPGDFELVEIGTAVAVFAFLPFCQMVRGNVVVDFFTTRATARVKALLDLAGNLLFTLIAAVLTWRLFLGAIDFASFGETTMVLRIPLWWGFVAAVPCMAFLTLVCGYTAWRSVREAAAGLHPAGGLPAGPLE